MSLIRIVYDDMFASIFLSPTTSVDEIRRTLHVYLCEHSTMDAATTQPHDILGLFEPNQLLIIPLSLLLSSSHLLVDVYQLILPSGVQSASKSAFERCEFAYEYSTSPASTPQRERKRWSTERSVPITSPKPQPPPLPLRPPQALTPKPVSSVLEFVLNASERRDLVELQRRTGFDSLSAREIVDIFERQTNVDGTMDSRTFARAFAQFVPAAKLRDADSQEEIAQILHRLFDLFDRNRDGIIDSRELTTGLTLLCAGDADEKTLVAFNALDRDGDGFITRDEMALYFTAFFTVAFDLSVSLQSTVGANTSVEQIGRATADQCFDEVDLNGDGRITFDEFRHWYTQPNQQARTGGTTPLNSHLTHRKGTSLHREASLRSGRRRADGSEDDVEEAYADESGNDLVDENDVVLEAAGAEQDELEEMIGSGVDVGDSALIDENDEDFDGGLEQLEFDQETVQKLYEKYIAMQYARRTLKSADVAGS